MDISSQDLDRFSVEDWVQAFSDLYEIPDGHKNGLHIWMNVIDDASELAENIRRGLYGDASRRIPHIFCWFCCFIAKYTTRYSDGDGDSIEGLLDTNCTEEYHITKWVYEKYPGRCPACGEKVCACPSFRDEVESRKNPNPAGETLFLPYWYIKGKIIKNDAKRAFEKYTEKVPLKNLEEMFRMIYSGVHHDLSLEAICFHLLEEIGEVVEIILDIEDLTKTKASGNKGTEIDSILGDLHEELKGELGDVFSWITAFTNKLNTIFKSTFPHHNCENFPKAANGNAEYNGFGLVRLISDEYIRNGKLVCTNCRSEKCNDECIEKKVIQDYHKRMLRKKAVKWSWEEMGKRGHDIYDMPRFSFANLKLTL